MSGVKVFVVCQGCGCPKQSHEKSRGKCRTVTLGVPAFRKDKVVMNQCDCKKYKKVRG